MIHSTCLNSAVSLRCRGSPSSPFNDPTYFLDARFHSNPLLISSSFSSCCCCCCCCAANSNSIYNRLPRVNPSYLCNGLRQSTLIQFSPSKRLIFNGRRRQSCNNTSGFSSLTDSDRNYYHEKLQSFKEAKKLRKDRYACWGIDDKRKEKFFSSGMDDDCVDEVEILLDLLTEVGLENIGVREKKRTNKKETKIVRSGAVKRDNKAVKIECKEEEEDRRVSNHRKEEERRTSIKGVNHESKKQGSSCSSYYSVSSTGEFESDNDVEIKHDFGGESSKDDQRMDSYRRSYDEENVETRDDFGKEKSEILKKNTAETYYGNQEWRKKTEKKLNVDSSQQQSQVSVHTNRNSQYNEKTDQSQSEMKYKRFMETSQMDNKLNTSVQEHRGETSDFRRQSNVISESSRIQEINMKEASSSSSSSSSLLEARKKNQEQNLTEVSCQVEDRRDEKQQRIDHLRVKSQQISRTSEVSSQVEDRRDEKQQRIDHSRVISQQLSRTSDTHVTNSENVSRTSEVSSQVEDRRDEKQQRIDHSRMKSQQLSRTTNTNVTNSENILKESNITSDHSTTLQESYSRFEKQELVLGTSSSAENVITSLRRKKIEDKSSSSGVELKEGTMESMKTGRRTTKASSFNVGMPMATSSTYKALKLNPEPNFQESSSHGEPEPQESPKFQRSEILRLDSANQQHKSSSHFVGEFVKNAEQEILNSQVQKVEKTHEAELVYEDAEQHEVKSSGEDGSGNTHQKDGPSDEMWHETGGADNTSSSGNGEIVKKSGRSLWNVIGDVVRFRWGSPRSETHTPKSGGGKAVSNRSTSSEAWFSGHEHEHEHEESHDEDVKTGKVSNPSKKKVQHEGFSDSQLLSSSSNPNHGSSSVIQESSFPSPAIRMRRSPAVKSSGSGESDASGSGKMVKTTEISPSDASGSGKMVEHEGLDSPFLSSSSNPNHGSSSVIEESSFPSPAIRMRRSPAVKSSGSGESDASGSGKMVKTTEILPSDASGSGEMVIVDQGVDGEELKRRKFARIDQVSKDRFDEWEEAYNFEAKQRKIDEFFMKEALLEARKAADLWEVPVGAVLVQDGNIIARGYNLVEELRDSTAHAEMICIREASTNLRSWRLSGSTLYVTLEPCPMCAGAILQARVDTVVWGAPNKLLGADGSWIRLFPDGNGENGSNKPPAPVHPFHPNMTVRRGVLSSECADVMQQFFQLRRKKKETKTEAEPPTPPPSCLPITHRQHHSKFFSKMHDAFNIMFCL